MKKNLNVIQKLEIVTDREIKRKNQAVNYLNKLTEILASSLEELTGETYMCDEDKALVVAKYVKEEDKFTDQNNLYFRYCKFEIDWKSDEHIGFYVNYSNNDLMFGTDLLEIKGEGFWRRVKEITDWVSNYLPGYIEENEKNNKKRLLKLKKIIEAIELAK